MAALYERAKATFNRVVASSRPGWVGGKPGAIEGLGGPPPEAWPAEADLPRLEQYARGLRLFLGDHVSLFDPNRDQERNGPYVMVNVCAAVTQALTDFLVLEPPRVTLVGRRREQGPDDAASGAPYTGTTDLARILRASHWPTFLQGAVNSWSYNGDMVLKVVWDEGQRCPKLKGIPPSRYFPIFDAEDNQVVDAVSLCWITELSGDKGDERGTLREELHVPGGYVVNTYRIVRDASGPSTFIPRFQRRLVDTSPMVQTGLDVIPIVHVPNSTILEQEPWGNSDYANVESLQQGLNDIASGNRHIVVKWSDPHIALDESYFDEDNNVNALDLTAIKLVQEEPPPQYVSVPLENYTHADNEAKETIRRMLMVMGISGPTVGIADDAPLPQSGRALLVGEGLTRRTGARKRAPLDNGLREALSIATQFWAAKEGTEKADQAAAPVESDDILLDWSDGFPKSDRERLEEVVLDKSVDYLSKYDLLRLRFPDWTQEEIEAAIERKRADLRWEAELQSETKQAERTPEGSNPDQPAADDFESGTGNQTVQQAEAKVRAGAEQPE